MTDRASSSSRSGATAMSAAGIVDDPHNNARVIPQSRRADGSIRKERKVKPGFVPAEDVARFVPSRVRQAQAEQRKLGPSGYAVMPSLRQHNDAPMVRSSSDGTPSSSPPPPPSTEASDWRASRSTKTSATASTATPSSPARVELSAQSAANSPSKPVWEPRNRAAAKQNGDATKDKIPDAWDEDENADDEDKRHSEESTATRAAPSSADQTIDSSSIDAVTSSLVALQIRNRTAPK